MTSERQKNFASFCEMHTVQVRGEKIEINLNNKKKSTQKTVANYT